MFVNTKRNSSVNIHLRFRHNVDWLTCGGGLCCPGMGPSQTTQVGTEKGTTDRQYWHIPIYRRKQTMGKLKQFHNKWENISKWNLIEYNNFLINFLLHVFFIIRYIEIDPKPHLSDVACWDRDFWWGGGWGGIHSICIFSK